MKLKRIVFFIIISIISFSIIVCGGEDNDLCADGHDFVWKVISAAYPAISAEKCSRCDTPSENNTRITIVGDTGPSGGIIIYTAVESFKIVGTESTAHYLEVSPVNLATASLTWASGNYPVDDTGTAIGTGMNNTKKIIELPEHSADTPANNAAKACSGYRYGGKDDWFLPSKDELNEFCKSNIVERGLFWSSSQDGTFTAWTHLFYGNTQTAFDKNTILSVRAVRAF